MDTESGRVRWATVRARWPARPSGEISVTIRIFLVDDHEIVRRGIADLIEEEPDLTVVGEASSVSEALARVPQSGAEVGRASCRERV